MPLLSSLSHEFNAAPLAGDTRASGDTGPNFDNQDLFHGQSPDIGRGVHARSWRANRDVDARCYFSDEV